MERADLTTGNQLVGLIDYYDAVLDELADASKKEKALYALLSSGNPQVAAGDDAAFITSLRNDVIADVIAALTTQKTVKETEFTNLGEAT